LRTLKSYVRNKSCPEGSIAEGYLAEECSTFCSRYLDSIETRFNQPTRNFDENASRFYEESLIFSQVGRSLGKMEPRPLDRTTWM